MPQRKKAAKIESDSTYFLKLVLYVIAGSFWIKLGTPVDLGGFVVSAFPLGFFVGLLFASHDHFQIDRKIEYAILIVIAIVSYFLPAGIVI